MARFNMPKIKRPSKTYMRNLARSGKYVARDQAREMMPTLTSTIANTRLALRTVSRFDRMTARDYGRQILHQKRALLGSLGEFISNAKEDLKSGKLYNQDRMAEDPFGSMLGGFGDADDEFGYDGSDYSYGANDESFMYSGVGGTATARQMSNTLGSVELDSAQYAADVSMLNTGKTMVMSQMHHMEIKSHLNNIESIGMSMLKFNQEVVASAIDRRDEFYRTTEQHLQEIKDTIQAQSELLMTRYGGGATRNNSSSILEEIISGSGPTGIDLKAYAKNIKKNIGNMMPVDKDTIKLYVDMYKNNPIGALLKGAMDNLIPKALNNKAKGTDTILSSLFSQFIFGMNKLKNNSTNKTMRTIGEILGVNIKKNDKPNLGTYRDGDLSKDLELKKAKAITEVIPTYLMKMTEALTGINKSYDYNKGIFVDNIERKKKLDKDIRSSAIFDMYGTHDALRTQLYKMKNVSKSQFDTIYHDVDNFVFFLSNFNEKYYTSLPYDYLVEKGLKLEGGRKSYKIISELFYRNMPPEVKANVINEQLRAAANRSYMMDITNQSLQDSGGSIVYNEFDDYSEYAKSRKIHMSSTGRRTRTTSSRKAQKTKEKDLRGLNLDDIFDASVSNEDARKEMEKAERERREAEGEVVEEKKENWFRKKIDKITSNLGDGGVVGKFFDYMNRGMYTVLYGSDKDKSKMSEEELARERELKERGMLGRAADFLSDMYKKANTVLFGDYDKDGNHKGNGVFSEEIGKALKRYIPKGIAGISTGAIAGLVFKHPILGAAAGGALSILSETGKVKEFLWGNGKDKKGLFGETGQMFKKFMKDEILSPLKKYTKNKFVGLTKKVSDLFTTIDQKSIDSGAYRDIDRELNELYGIDTGNGTDEDDEEEEFIEDAPRPTHSEVVKEVMTKDIYGNKLNNIIRILKNIDDDVRGSFGADPRYKHGSKKKETTTTNTSSNTTDTKAKSKNKENKSKKSKKKKSSKNSASSSDSSDGDGASATVIDDFTNETNDSDNGVHIDSISREEIADNVATAMVREEAAKDPEIKKGIMKEVRAVKGKILTSIKSRREKSKEKGPGIIKGTATNILANYLSGENTLVRDSKRTFLDKKFNIAKYGMTKGTSALLGAALGTVLFGNPLLGGIVGAYFGGRSDKQQKAFDEAGLNNPIKTKASFKGKALGGLAGLMMGGPLGMLIGSKIGGSLLTKNNKRKMDVKYDFDRYNEDLNKYRSKTYLTTKKDKLQSRIDKKNDAIAKEEERLTKKYNIKTREDVDKIPSEELAKLTSLIESRDDMMNGMSDLDSDLGKVSDAENPDINNYKRSWKERRAFKAKRKEEEAEAKRQKVAKGTFFDRLTGGGKGHGAAIGALGGLLLGGPLGMLLGGGIGLAKGTSRSKLNRDRTGGILAPLGRGKATLISALAGSMLLGPILGPLLGGTAGFLMSRQKDKKWWKYDENGKILKPEQMGQQWLNRRHEAKYDYDKFLNRREEIVNKYKEERQKITDAYGFSSSDNSADYDPYSVTTGDGNLSSTSVDSDRISAERDAKLRDLEDNFKNDINSMNIKDYKRGWRDRRKKRKEIDERENKLRDDNEKLGAKAKRGLESLQMFSVGKGTGTLKGAQIGSAFGGPLGMLAGAAIGNITSGKKDKKPDGTKDKPLYIKDIDRAEEKKSAGTSESNKEAKAKREERAVSVVEVQARNSLLSANKKAQDTKDENRNQEIRENYANFSKRVIMRKDISWAKKRELLNQFAMHSEMLESEDGNNGIMGALGGKKEEGGPGSFLGSLIGNLMAHPLRTILSGLLKYGFPLLGVGGSILSAINHGKNEEYNQMEGDIGNAASNTARLLGKTKWGSKLLIKGAKIAAKPFKLAGKGLKFIGGKIGGKISEGLSKTALGKGVSAFKNKTVDILGKKLTNSTVKTVGNKTTATVMTGKVTKTVAENGGKLGFFNTIKTWFAKGIDAVADKCPNLFGGKFASKLRSLSSRISEGVFKSVEKNAEKALAKGSAELGAKTAEATAKTSNPIGWAIMLAQLIYDFTTGFFDANNIMDTATDYEAPLALKVTTGLVKMLDGLAFNIPSLSCSILGVDFKKEFSKIIYSFFGSEEDIAKLEASQESMHQNYEEFIAANPGTTLTEKEYSELTNKSTWRKMTSFMDWLPWRKNLDDYRTTDKELSDTVRENKTRPEISVATRDQAETLSSAASTTTNTLLAGIFQLLGGNLDYLNANNQSFIIQNNQKTWNIDSDAMGYDTLGQTAMTDAMSGGRGFNSSKVMADARSLVSRDPRYIEKYLARKNSDRLRALADRSKVGESRLKTNNMSIDGAKVKKLNGGRGGRDNPGWTVVNPDDFFNKGAGPTTSNRLSLNQGPISKTNYVKQVTGYEDPLLHMGEAPTKQRTIEDLKPKVSDSGKITASTPFSLPEYKDAELTQALNDPSDENVGKLVDAYNNGTLSDTAASLVGLNDGNTNRNIGVYKNRITEMIKKKNKRTRTNANVTGDTNESLIQFRNPSDTSKFMGATHKNRAYVLQNTGIQKQQETNNLTNKSAESMKASIQSRINTMKKSEDKPWYSKLWGKIKSAAGAVAGTVGNWIQKAWNWLTGGRGSDWMSIVRAVKEALAAKAPTYSQGATVDIEVGGKTINVRTDCSGFVSACLNAYGVYSGKMSSGAMLSPNGEMAGTGFTYHKWAGWDALSEGDIVASSSHTEIFSRNEGGKHYVYNAGSTASIQKPGETVSGNSSYDCYWSPGGAGSGAVNASNKSSGDTSSSGSTSVYYSTASRQLTEYERIKNNITRRALTPNITYEESEMNAPETMNSIVNNPAMRGLMYEAYKNGASNLSQFNVDNDRAINFGNSNNQIAYSANNAIKDRDNNRWYYGVDVNSGRVRSMQNPATTKMNELFGGRGTTQSFVGRSNDPDYYNQQDSRWGNMSFGRYDGARDTVADGGCGPTTAATVIQKMTGNRVTPAETSRFALHNGYKVDDGGTTPDYYDAVGQKYGVRFTQHNPMSATTIRSLQQGKPVVFLGHDSTGTSPFGSDSHYVIGTGIDKRGNIDILDPKRSENNHKYHASDIIGNSYDSIVPHGGRGPIIRLGRGFTPARRSNNISYRPTRRRTSSRGRGNSISRSISNYLRGRSNSTMRRRFGGRGLNIVNAKDYPVQSTMGTRNASDIKYIVLHNIQGVVSDPDHFMGNSSGNNKYFAHYQIGTSGTIYRLADDTTMTRHCGAYCGNSNGGADVRNVSASQPCNENSIGIEISNAGSPSSFGGENVYWNFSGAALASARDLVNSLMSKYGIDKDHVVRHFDCNGNMCPAPWISSSEKSGSKGDRAGFEEFKASLTGGDSSGSSGRSLTPQTAVAEAALAMQGKMTYTQNITSSNSTSAISKFAAGNGTEDRWNIRNGWGDCSSFVAGIYNLVLGMNIGTYTGDEDTKGNQVISGKKTLDSSDVSRMQPGDLIFSSHGGGASDHVGMYVGNGKVINLAGDGETDKAGNPLGNSNRSGSYSRSDTKSKGNKPRGPIVQDVTSYRSGQIIQVRRYISGSESINRNLGEFMSCDGQKYTISLNGSGSGGMASSPSNPALKDHDGFYAPKLVHDFPFYLQGDSRWGSKPYGPKGTLEKAACGSTSMAMILTSYGISMDPIMTAQWAVDNGYRTMKSVGTDWPFFPAIAKAKGLECEDLGSSIDKAYEKLKNGIPVISSQDPGAFTKEGHFIVLCGIDSEGGICVNDPASESRTNKKWSKEEVGKAQKNAWAFTKNGVGSIGNVGSAGDGSSTSALAKTKYNKGNRLLNKLSQYLEKIGIGTRLSGFIDAITKGWDNSGTTAEAADNNSTSSGSSSSGSSKGSTSNSSGSNSITGRALTVDEAWHHNITAYSKDKITAESLKKAIDAASQANGGGTNRGINKYAQDIIDAANSQGIDPRFLATMGIMEAGWDMNSDDAKNKHNFFGINHWNGSPAGHDGNVYESDLAGWTAGAEFMRSYVDKYKQDSPYLFTHSEDVGVSGHNYTVDDNGNAASFLDRAKLYAKLIEETGGAGSRGEKPRFGRGGLPNKRFLKRIPTSTSHMKYAMGKIGPGNVLGDMIPDSDPDKNSIIKLAEKEGYILDQSDRVTYTENGRGSMKSLVSARFGRGRKISIDQAHRIMNRTKRSLDAGRGQVNPMNKIGSPLPRVVLPKSVNNTLTPIPSVASLKDAMTLKKINSARGTIDTVAEELQRSMANTTNVGQPIVQTVQLDGDVEGKIDKTNNINGMMLTVLQSIASTLEVIAGNVGRRNTGFNYNTNMYSNGVPNGDEESYKTSLMNSIVSQYS